MCGELSLIVDLIKKAHFLPDEGSTKEYEILLDLIDSGPENWDENSVSFVDKSKWS